MQGPDYIFCLQDKDYKFWGMDETTGVITKSTQPYFLVFSPAGWDEIAIQNLRNLKYWGADRSVTIPLNYVIDGARILKYIFYTLGIEEEVYLTIASQQLQYTPSVEYFFWYKQIYRGQVDLGEFMHVGSKVSCKTLEDGLPKYLKANENTTHEIPFNVIDAINVKMDGIRLRQKLNYEAMSDYEIHRNQLGLNWYAPFTLVAEEGDSTGILTQSSALLDFSALTLAASENYLIRNVSNISIEFTLSGEITFTCTDMVSSPAYSCWIRLYKADGTLVATLVEALAMAVGQTYSAVVNETVTIAPNEKLFIVGTYGGAGSGADVAISFHDTTKLNIAFITRYQPTYIKAFTAQYLFTKFINLVTEGTYTAAAATYFKIYSWVVFTSGNAIRGLEDAVLKMSWADFFQFWDSFDAVGIYDINKVVHFDTKQNMIDTTNVIDLDGPAFDTFKTSVAKNFLFNELEVGYPPIRNDVGVLNGNQETNSKMLFSTKATTHPAKLDKVSKVKSSCYEIEKIRVTTLEKDTTDFKADNDTFALAIVFSPIPASGDIPEHYELDRTLNASATGVLEAESIFNLKLSPKRNMYRNGPFLRSSFFLGDALNLIFRTHDKNKELVCDGITEKSDENVGSLGDKWFIPMTMDGEFPIPEDILFLLDQNPLQVFQFPIDGHYFKGLLMKVVLTPGRTRMQSCSFLSLADNPLTKLIDYNG